MEKIKVKFGGREVEVIPGQENQCEAKHIVHPGDPFNEMLYCILNIDHDGPHMDWEGTDF